MLRYPRQIYYRFPIHLEPGPTQWILNSVQDCRKAYVEWKAYLLLLLEVHVLIMKSDHVESGYL